MPAKSLAYLQANKLPAISWELAEEKDSQARSKDFTTHGTAKGIGFRLTLDPSAPNSHWAMRSSLDATMCKHWIWITARDLWTAGIQILNQINLPDKRDTLSSLCWTINKSVLCPRGRHYVNIVGKIVQNKAASASAHKMCRNVTKPGKLFQQLHSCYGWIYLSLWLPTPVFLQPKMPHNSISISAFHSILIDYKLHKKEEQMPRTVPSTKQAICICWINEWDQNLHSVL